MDALKRDVLAYLNHGNSFVGIRDQAHIGLLDILSEENIQVVEHAGSWKDMIQTASPSAAEPWHHSKQLCTGDDSSGG